jgi:hypothetical protein
MEEEEEEKTGGGAESEDEEAEGVLLMNPRCQVAPCRSLVSGQELCRDFLHLALHTNSRWHSCKFFPALIQTYSIKLFH